MSLRELFPTYPLGLRTPPNSRIRFGTRNTYVDLPWRAYRFLTIAMNKAMKTDLTAEEIREEWRRFLRDNASFLTFRGKPLASVYLRSDRFSGNEFLMLRIRWDTFVAYLDNEAETFMSEIKNRGKDITKFYGEIWMNFFNLKGEIRPPETMYFPFSLERFKRLLKMTGDYFHLIGLLENLKDILRFVKEKMKREVPIVELYTTNLLMSVQHLHALIDVLNVPAAYLMLRNILEDFIELLVYLDVARSFDSNLVLSMIFLYDYESTAKKRMYSLKKFRREFVKKLLRTGIDSESEQPLSADEYVNRFKKKNVPILGIKPSVLDEFQELHNIKESNLSELYIACSEIIHNQSPLPFFSLREMKLLKYFLRNYVESLQTVTEEIFSEKINLTPIKGSSILQHRKALKDCLETARSLVIHHEMQIKETIKEATITLQKDKPDILTDPLTLASLLRLVTPSFHGLRACLLAEEDLDYLMDRIQPLAFTTYIKQSVHLTLDQLQQMIMPELEKYEAFSSLRSQESKRRVILYILIYYLPQIIEETMSS